MRRLRPTAGLCHVVLFTVGCATTPFTLDRTPIIDDDFGPQTVGVAEKDVQVTLVNGTVPMPVTNAALVPHVARVMNRALDATEGASGVTTKVKITETGPAFLTYAHTFAFTLSSTLPSGETVVTEARPEEVGGGGDVVFAGCIPGLALCCTLPVVVMAPLTPVVNLGLVPLLASAALAVPGFGLLAAQTPLVNAFVIEPQDTRASLLFLNAMRAHAKDIQKTLAATGRNEAGSLAAAPEAGGDAAGSWFYAVASDKRGPVPVEVLSAEAKKKVVTKATLVWREGMADWAAAGSVRELATLWTAPPSGLWFYSSDNTKRLGPVDGKALVALIQAKTVTPDTLVWQEGMPDWRAAGEVPSVKPFFSR